MKVYIFNKSTNKLLTDIDVQVVGSTDEQFIKQAWNDAVKDGKLDGIAMSDCTFKIVD